MEEKITLNLFYMGLISAILAALCSGFAFFSVFRTQVQADLQQQGELIASAYEETEQPESLAQFAGNQLRITLIEQDGTVLYESAADASTMENHLDRPEVPAAAAEPPTLWVLRTIITPCCCPPEKFSGLPVRPAIFIRFTAVRCPIWCWPSAFSWSWPWCSRYC